MKWLYISDLCVNNILCIYSSFIHSLIQQTLLSTYYLPGIVWWAGYTKKHKTTVFALDKLSMKWGGAVAIRCNKCHHMLRNWELGKLSQKRHLKSPGECLGVNHGKRRGKHFTGQWNRSVKKGNAELAVFGLEWQLMNLESWMGSDYGRPFKHALRSLDYLEGRQGGVS